MSFLCVPYSRVVREMANERNGRQQEYGIFSDGPTEVQHAMMSRAAGEQNNEAKFLHK